MLSEFVCVSNVNTLSLEEYCCVCQYLCSQSHAQFQCKECPAYVLAAKMILKEKLCTLSAVFKGCFPHIRYKTDSAKRCLMCMPLASIRVGEPSSGKSQTFVMELVPNADYNMVRHILMRFQPLATRKELCKEEVQDLLNLAQTHREKECLRYAIFKSSGMTPHAAHKKFGFTNMKAKSERVENCIEELKSVRRSFEEVAHTRIKALISSCELAADSESSPDPVLSESCLSTLVDIMKKSKFNWFQFRECVAELDSFSEELNSKLEVFYKGMSTLFSDDEKQLIKQSYEAFTAEEELNAPQQDRTCRGLNGDVVTDSESDDPDTYLYTTQDSKLYDAVIDKKVAKIKRQILRQQAKYIEEKHFLGKCKSKKLSSIPTKYPDIGDTIEKYVQSCNVGADSWRRTGLLTFDGNRKVNKKCTYKQIQQHLEATYHRHFSYGTVIQLCVARNRRRLS